MDIILALATKYGLQNHCVYMIVRSVLETRVGVDADHHVQHYVSTYWVNVFVKAASYPNALCLIFAFVSLMPSMDSIIRRAGSRALGPYLLHWLFIWFVEKYTSWFSNWEIKHTVPLYCLLAAYMLVLYLPEVYACVLVFLNVPLEKLGLLKSR